MCVCVCECVCASVCVCAALDYYFIMSAAGKMEGCCVPKDLPLDTVQKGGKMKFVFIFISVSPSIPLSSSAFPPPVLLLFYLSFQFTSESLLIVLSTFSGINQIQAGG